MVNSINNIEHLLSYKRIIPIYINHNVSRLAVIPNSAVSVPQCTFVLQIPDHSEPVVQTRVLLLYFLKQNHG